MPTPIQSQPASWTSAVTAKSSCFSRDSSNPTVSLPDPPSQGTGGKGEVVRTFWGHRGWVCCFIKERVKLRFWVEDAKALAHSHLAQVVELGFEPGQLGCSSLTTSIYRLSPKRKRSGGLRYRLLWEGRDGRDLGCVCRRSQTGRLRRRGQLGIEGAPNSRGP